jgi:hypothetical protein
VGELLERSKNLDICASRASVMAALDRRASECALLFKLRDNLKAVSLKPSRNVRFAISAHALPIGPASTAALNSLGTAQTDERAHLHQSRDRRK